MQDHEKSMEERREETSIEGEKLSKPGYATLLSDLLVKLKKDLEIEKRLKSQSDVTTKQGQRPELNSKYMDLDSLLVNLLIKMAKENRKEKLIKEKSDKGPKSKRSKNGQATMRDRPDLAFWTKILANSQRALSRFQNVGFPPNFSVIFSTS